MFYITFHGTSKHRNNIYTYPIEKNQQQPKELLVIDNSDPPLEELRAFQFIGDQLFVVNGHKSYSQLLIFQKYEDNQYHFNKKYASIADIKGMIHPYDFTFDSNDNCYISNQDTNTVIGLSGPNTPLDIASALLPYNTNGKHFYKGTIVASSNGDLPAQKHPRPDVATPQGLDVTISNSEVSHSVRGVLYYEDYLIVADEPSNAVKIYSLPSGKYSGMIKGSNLMTPVQLLIHGEQLYIGSSGNGSVVSVPLSSISTNGKIIPTTFVDGGIDKISGMAFDSEGNFYATERENQTLVKVQVGTSTPKPLITNLIGQPEFLVIQE